MNLLGGWSQAILTQARPLPFICSVEVNNTDLQYPRCLEGGSWVGLASPTPYTDVFCNPSLILPGKSVCLYLHWTWGVWSKWLWNGICHDASVGVTVYIVHDASEPMLQQVYVPWSHTGARLLGLCCKAWMWAYSIPLVPAATAIGNQWMWALGYAPPGCSHFCWYNEDQWKVRWGPINLNNPKQLHEWTQVITSQMVATVVIITSQKEGGEMSTVRLGSSPILASFDLIVPES